MSAKSFSSQHLFIVANSWNVFSPLLLSELPVFRNKNALQLWQSGSQCITLWLWANQCWKNSDRLCSLSQPCPRSMSCDQSAAEHTSGSYQKNTQVHVGLLQLEVLFYNTDLELEWSILLPPLPQSTCQADFKSCSYSTEQLKRLQHFIAIPLGITVSNPKLFLCGISSRI